MLGGQQPLPGDTAGLVVDLGQVARPKLIDSKVETVRRSQVIQNAVNSLVGGVEFDSADVCFGLSAAEVTDLAKQHVFETGGACCKPELGHFTTLAWEQIPIGTSIQ
jgi:hypothetical protein